jgi:multidrug resistance efflux pump
MNRAEETPPAMTKGEPVAIGSTPGPQQSSGPSGPASDEAAVPPGASPEPPAAPEAAAQVAAPPPDRVRKIIAIVAAVLLLLYVYQVVADRITPYTSQANVDTFLVQIAPQVTGEVTQVGVTDNSMVKKGQVLFRIDPELFEIALRKAEADLAVANQSADVSSVEIGVAQAALQKQRVDLAASRQLGKITIDLVKERALAETNAIRARADISKTEADVRQAEAEVLRAQRNLGSLGPDNPKVRQALAAVRQARTNLDNTIVIAPADGVVTNLRLAPGQYVSQGQPLLSFIRSGPRWISAAMRENQLGNLAPGNRVLVALDDNPGAVVPGRVESIGWGITQGEESPTGTLPSIEADTGWLREPQRFPVRIMLTPDKEMKSLATGRSGAQANVIVFTDKDSILNPLGRLWIRLVALLSYLQ